MMQFNEMSDQELVLMYEKLKREYENIKQQDLKLDMSRGKPAADQLDLSMDMLKQVIGVYDCKAENGFDCRNYGILEGVNECKRLFSEMLEVPVENIILGGTSSLALMFDYITQCMLTGSGAEPWSKQGKIKFICNVPGYDRHFSICEYYGIEMISVPLTEEGPDMDIIEELIKDESVKGMFCVPKYSNPTGITYSDSVVRRLARMEPAAKDFRVIWDNAYAVHDITNTPDTLLNIFDECKKYGTEDYFVEFTSTAKISFPGGGISCIAASDNNKKMILDRLSKQTICYDKLNQLRHARFFRDLEGIKLHMKKHAALIAPKFDIVIEAFNAELKEYDLASWTEPNGGYFISLDTKHCSAKRVGELCRSLGVVLTDVGATYPYGVDPDDRNIRIAPSFPTVVELKKAAEILCLCIKLASIENLV
ncbi:MAG: aminotransferase class I/II-fold pyridoxal phosphate-dependent enzyme [Clostridia bacterium]|nr:aminotransferase class I/II-fold pyridoxal phosphate-dependent enzyme [Clostridia bacterium]